MFGERFEDPQQQTIQVERQRDWILERSLCVDVECVFHRSALLRIMVIILDTWKKSALKSSERVSPPARKEWHRIECLTTVSGREKRDSCLGIPTLAGPISKQTKDKVKRCNKKPAHPFLRTTCTWKCSLFAPRISFLCPRPVNLSLRMLPSFAQRKECFNSCFVWC